MTVPLHRVRNYEELEGAQGREVFFRPERYRAKDLVPLRSEVMITVAGSERFCPLLDLSENGAAFEWPSALVPAIGDRFGSLSVRFDSHESYRGEARVGSVREIDGAATPVAPLYVPGDQLHRMPARMKDCTNCR